MLLGLFGTYLVVLVLGTPWRFSVICCAGSSVLVGHSLCIVHSAFCMYVYLVAVVTVQSMVIGIVVQSMVIGIVFTGHGHA